MAACRKYPDISGNGGRYLMKTISFCNQKGGVGKTTSALALASGLGKKGFRVLLLDLDPQCNASLASKIDILSDNDTLYNVFRGGAGIKDVIRKVKRYDIVTGGLALAAADMEFTQTGREYMLREALEDISSAYDYCIIDTAPSLGIITVNALTASQRVIIPMTPDLFSLQGLSQLNQLVSRVKRYSNKDLTTEGLLITLYDTTTNISKALKEQIENAAVALGTKVFTQPIRKSVAVREAHLMRTDIFTGAPKANATKDYEVFVDEVLNGGKNGE